MALLRDIIDELLDSKITVADPLYKTSVLATRIKNTELLNWVDKEVGGYNVNDELPEYRKMYSELSMDYIKGHNQFFNQPVPLIGLPDKFVEQLTTFIFRQPISVLEKIAASNGEGVLENPVPSEIIQMLQNHIRQIGHNPNFQILAFYKRVSISVVVEIAASVRYKLLKFMLAVEVEFGEAADIESLGKSNSKVTTIMYQTINNAGNGNVINTGNKASLNVNINIVKGDFDSLAKELRDKNVEEADIAELKAIVEDEVISENSKKFSPRLNKWIIKVSEKALSGGWDIGAGVSSGILTELLKPFFGIN